MAPWILIRVTDRLREQRSPGHDERQTPHRQPRNPAGMIRAARPNSQSVQPYWRQNPLPVETHTDCWGAARQTRFHVDGCKGADSPSWGQDPMNLEVPQGQ
jgi:hypothetical protein